MKIEEEPQEEKRRRVEGRRRGRGGEEECADSVSGEESREEEFSRTIPIWELGL